MASTARGGEALSALLKSAARIRPACTQCLRAVRARPRLSPISTLPFVVTSSTPFSTSTQRHTALATSLAPTELAATTPPPSSRASTPPVYRLRAGLMLSRPPLLTRDPTPFESAFYLYQKRLNERLASSFRRELYFKRDTSAIIDWRLQLRDRHGTLARDIGVYAGGKGRRARTRAWNDELTLDDPDAAWLSDPAALRERIVSDADIRVSDDGVPLPEIDRIRVDRPLPRTSPADDARDTTRLDRKLDRTLYLVVRGGSSAGLGPAAVDSDNVWAFPTADLQTDDTLHETAARGLAAAVGVNMNTWIVGRAPVAHMVRVAPTANGDIANGGDKTFFLKGRIMAGQADLTSNTLGVKAFQWLTKEELAETLLDYYFASVKNALSAR